MSNNIKVICRYVSDLAAGLWSKPGNVLTVLCIQVPADELGREEGE